MDDEWVRIWREAVRFKVVSRYPAGGTEENY
jgi:hypothetical protein